MRKEVAEMYPSEEFLTLAHAAGIPLVISSDAHAPEEVGADFRPGRSAREGGRLHRASHLREAPARQHPTAIEMLSTSTPPQIIGIVNINDDSFSGDGSTDTNIALEQARAMIAAGADIIDLGAESARTNRGPISVAEEIARLQPVIAALKSSPTPPRISVNTWRPEVAAKILPMGIDLLNDIGALPDDRNARLCAEHGCALLIMHSVGLPKIPHTAQRYNDVWGAILTFFKEKIAMAENAGVPREKIVLDPGIDFAKQRDDNLAIYRHLERLKAFNLPILLPVSRKTVIGDVLDLANPSDRDAGTVACIAAGLSRGANIFRVHNVTAAKQTLQVLAEI